MKTGDLPDGAMYGTAVTGLNLHVLVWYG